MNKGKSESWKMEEKEMLALVKNINDCHFSRGREYSLKEKITLLLNPFLTSEDENKNIFSFFEILGRCYAIFFSATEILERCLSFFEETLEELYTTYSSFGDEYHLNAKDILGKIYSYSPREDHPRYYFFLSYRMMEVIINEEILDIYFRNEKSPRLDTVEMCVLYLKGGIEKLKRSDYFFYKIKGGNDYLENIKAIDSLFSSEKDKMKFCREALFFEIRMEEMLKIYLAFLIYCELGDKREINHLLDKKYLSSIDEIISFDYFFLNFEDDKTQQIHHLLQNRSSFISQRLELLKREYGIFSFDGGKYFRFVVKILSSVSRRHLLRDFPGFQR